MCFTVTINHVLGNSGSWNPFFQETGLKLLVPKKQLLKTGFSWQPVLILEWHMGEMGARWWSCFPRSQLCACSCTGGATVIYFPSIRGFTGQIVRGVESDKGMHHCIFALQARYINRLFSFSHYTEVSPVPL